MPENFPELMADTKPETHEVQKTPNRINTKLSTCQCIIFKLQNVRQRKKILKKAGGENYLTHGKARIELHQISLFRNQANEWNGTFRVLKEKSTNA